MAAGIVYLDVDDEITSAAQRIRSVAGDAGRARRPVRLADRDLADELPAALARGARRATAGCRSCPATPRRGRSRRRPACRSSARSAEYEDGRRRAGRDEPRLRRAGGRGRSRRRRPPRPTAAAAARRDRAATTAGRRRRPSPRSAAAADGAARLRTPRTRVRRDGPDRRSRRRRRADGRLGHDPEPRPEPADRRPRGRAVTRPRGAAVPRLRDPGAVARRPGRGRPGLVVLGVGGYLFLPSATIAVTPASRADRDPADRLGGPGRDRRRRAAGVVPAVRLDVPVEASQTFTTTGVHVEEAAAKGSVTFTNYDTSSGDSIPAGSIVSTEGGIRFRTQATVALQPARSSSRCSIRPSRSVQVGRGQGRRRRQRRRRTRSGSCRRARIPSLLKVNNPSRDDGRRPHRDPGGHRSRRSTRPWRRSGRQLQTSFDDADRRGRRRAAGHDAVPGDRHPRPRDADRSTRRRSSARPSPTFDLGADGDGDRDRGRPAARSGRSPRPQLEAAGRRRTTGSSTARSTSSVGDGTVGEDGQVTFQATAQRSAGPRSSIADQLAVARQGQDRGRGAGRARAVRRRRRRPLAGLGLDRHRASTPGSSSPSTTIRRPAAAPIGRHRRPRRSRRHASRQPASRRAARHRASGRRPVTRLLGLDLGERRIGVAVADADGDRDAADDAPPGGDPARDAAAIARLAREQRVDRDRRRAAARGVGRGRAARRGHADWVDGGPAAPRAPRRAIVTSV